MRLERSPISNRRSGFPGWRAKRGFTLVELLVAATITVVLAGMMISITSGVMTAWNRSRGGISTTNEAKVLQDQITRDLEGVVLRRDGQVWLTATVQPDQSGSGDSRASMASWDSSGAGLMKPGWDSPGTADSSLDLLPTSSKIEDYRFGMAGAWLRMITTPSDANDSELHNTSAPRAVAYQIIRYTQSTDSGSLVRYGLFRSEVRPFDSDSSTAVRSTFNVGYDLFNAPYDDPNATIPGSSQKAGFLSADPGTMRRPDRSMLIANNVIDFGIRVFARDSTGALTLAFPITQTNLAFAASSLTSLPPVVGGHSYSGEITYAFPETIEVFVRILSDEGATKIAALESGKITGVSWWDVALQNSRVMTWRVEVKSRALGN